MQTNQKSAQQILTVLAVLLAGTPVVQAATVTVTGPDVTIMKSNNQNGWLAVTDTTSNGSPEKVTQSTNGALARFDPALGVLTNAVATAANTRPTQSLVKSGGTGSVSASSFWTLGGNAGQGFTTSQSSNGANSSWSPMVVTSTAGNLNNFVGSGNIATNNFNSTFSANRTGGTTAVGGRITPDLTYSESIVYTYLTHGNASFTSPGDTNTWNIDFGTLVNGAGASQAFSIFDLGDLGLTNFSFSFLSGDNFFDITGGNSILAGSSGLYSAQFLAQNPVTPMTFSATYRLSFQDDISGLPQFASNSVGGSYIDLTMVAAQGPAAVPEPGSLLLSGLGLGLLGLLSRRRPAA